jgi:hypothetical protein
VAALEHELDAVGVVEWLVEARDIELREMEHHPRDAMGSMRQRRPLPRRPGARSRQAINVTW